MPSLIQTIKQVAMEAFKASRPTSVLYGEVISISPIKIKIAQNKILEEAFLILTNNVKDHIVTLKLYESEARDYTLYKGLKEGEKVMLIQVQGGQDYVVLDRM